MMIDHSDLMESDPFWDLDYVERLSNKSLVEKMRQTCLSRISYHRDRARKNGDLPLSKQIGTLLWLNRMDLLSVRGSERLLFLQSKAPWSALSQGMEFAQRLEKEEKLQSDLYHWMVTLNCFRVTKALRLFRVRTLGVGYRDKGTLPSPSTSAVRKAQEQSWVPKDQLPEVLVTMIDPSSDLLEGEWVDLPGLVEHLKTGLTTKEIHSLLTR